MYDDETLIDCINYSGYYECEDINIDDLPNDKRISIILAGALLALRPELRKLDSDILYIKKIVLENGKSVFDIPQKSLISILKNEPPFEDSSIYTYSVKECKLMKRIYKGTGTNWERVK